MSDESKETSFLIRAKLGASKENARRLSDRQRGVPALTAYIWKQAQAQAQVLFKPRVK